MESWTNDVGQMPDIDLGADASQHVEAAAPGVPSTASLGHAEKVAFRIWDGRRVVMTRLNVDRYKQIQVDALGQHPESPMAANAFGLVRAVKSCLVQVGNDRLGTDGCTTEHLYKALGSKGVETCEDMWRLMHRTTPEEDAAFLASIEVL